MVCHTEIKWEGVSVHAYRFYAAIVRLRSLNHGPSARQFPTLLEIPYIAEIGSAPRLRVARKKGVYAGRLKGTTKGKPTRARTLKDQGLTIAEIANTMAVSKRTIFRYLSEK